MAEALNYVDPKDIKPNPENPRLIFREEELRALQESIAQQGILVPLTVFQDKKNYVILDGERRWKCALRLGLTNVPVIVQPKPDRLTNIMMMFAIHKSRKDWDPLPTAYKLQELEGILTKRQGKKPSERVLAENASISIGEVRRLKRLLGLPEDLQKELMTELQKERSEQVLTVDHVVEAASAALSLRKKEIITPKEEQALTRAIVGKFREKKIESTVEPRKLTRLAQAVDRGQIERSVARRVVAKVTKEPEYSIEKAYQETVAEADFQHGLKQLAERLVEKLDEQAARKYKIDDDTKSSLKEILRRLQRLGV